MSYSVHSGQEALDALCPAWDALAERCPSHVFQTTGFARAWSDTIGPATKATPLIITYERDGDTVALFPASVIRAGVVPLVTWLGGSHVLDYGDILFDPARADVTVDQFVTEAISLLHRHALGAFLYLPNVRRDATCYGSLARSMRELGHDVAPYLTLADTYADYMTSLGKKRRHNLSNFEHRLERAGHVGFRVLEPDDPDFNGVVAEVLRLQRLRFAHLPANSLIFNPCCGDFRFVHAQHDGGPIAAALTLDGHLIAGSLQCVYGNRMYYLVTAFDQEFAEFAPGKLLVRRLIEYSFDEHLGVFDFCLGDESYKYFWTRDVEPLSSFVSSGPAGRLLATAAGLRKHMMAVASTFT